MSCSQWVLEPQSLGLLQQGYWLVDKMWMHISGAYFMQHYMLTVSRHTKAITTVCWHEDIAYLAKIARLVAYSQAY